MKTSDAETTGSDIGPDESTQARPRRRRSTRAAGGAAATEPGAATVSLPAEPDLARDATPAPRPGDWAPANPNAGEPGAPSPAAADGAQGEADSDGSKGEPDPGKMRRGRNRRRGRRRDDGERASTSADAAAGDGSATTPAAPARAGELFADVVCGAFDAATAPVAGDGELGPPGPTGEPVLAAQVAEGAAAIDAGDGTAPTQPEGAEAGEPAAAGSNDAVPAHPEGAARRVLAPEPDAPKLHKLLAQAGVGSRRDLEQMIADGRVTVNGQAAHTGQRVSFGDRIAIDGKPVRVRIAPPRPRVLAYHKPVGEVVTHDDPQQRPTVFRRLPRLPQGKWQSVGRLDINTEGLLLFTNSGELANQLMHPRFGVEREYAVRSLGELSDEQRQQLLDGVEIDGQRAAFLRIEDGGGEGVNRWYRVVIGEGRNREVRRMFEAVGHAVSRLIRIRYGSVVLPRGLKRGMWVDLGDDDLRVLRRQAGDAAPRPGGVDGAAQAGKRGRPAKGGRPERGSHEPRPAQPARGGGPRPPAGPDPMRQTFDRTRAQPPRPVPRVADLDEDEDELRGPIPDPLRQTFDRTRVQSRRNVPRVAEIDEDGDEFRGPIPNPLQQTFDKRHLQRPGPLGGRKQGGGGPGGTREPDPMQTSVGYIGADAFVRKFAGGSKHGGAKHGAKRGGGKRR